MISFPTLVYRCPGAHHREGGTFDYLAVADDAELKAALKDGWHMTLPAAIDPEEYAAPTRDELEAKAKELGLKFDGRTSDSKLYSMIEKAL